MNRTPLSERLLATFLGELEEQLRGIGQDLLELERRPQDEALLKAVFRSFHTLKGAAHAAGVPMVESACHALEGLLARVREGRATFSDRDFKLLFSSVDALADAAQRLRRADELEGSPLDKLLPSLRMASPSATAVGTRRTVGKVQPVPSTPPAAIPPPEQTRTAPPADDRMATHLRVDTAKVDALLASVGEVLIASGRLTIMPAAARALHEKAAHAARTWQRAMTRLRSHSADDRLVGSVEEIARALDGVVAESAHFASEMDGGSRHLAQLAGDLGDRMRSLRLRSVAEACEALPRVVRDVASASGTQAQLELLGQHVEADRGVIDALREALTHLVRNAVDHGLEPPAERMRRGKPAAGRITVSAMRRGERLAITVKDDGRGIDLQALRNNLARSGRPAPADDAELIAMLLHGGISSRQQSTSFSGRGVGLDAARAIMERIRGRIDIRFAPGAGTVVTLECPLMLTMARVLVMRLGAFVVAVPVDGVERLLRLRPADIRRAGGRDVIEVPHAAVPLLSLARLLGVPFAEPASADIYPVVVLADKADRIALVVDRLADEQEVLIRPLERLRPAPPLIVGGAVLPTGEIALVLDPARLIAAGLSHDGEAFSATRAATKAPRRHRILVVDDSITTRTLEQSILETAGYDVRVAADGAEAWDLLQRHEVDLVVSDVEMPRLDGFELCQSIRASARLAELPVVLVTGLESAEQRERGLAVGANAYILKSSFDQEQLLERIRQLLG